MADFYRFTLKAGIDNQVSIKGKMILVDDLDGADGVDITPMLNGSTGRTMPGRKKAFKCWVDYDAVVLRSDTDCTVAIWLAKTDVSLGFTDGAFVNVAGGVSITNDQGSRVPVDLAGGVVNVNATNVGINNDDENAVPVRTQALSTIVDGAPVQVNSGQALMIVSDPTLRRLRIRNASDSARVALGGPGVTLAGAAIVLQPGDIWMEDDAPGAAWYAVSDTNGAAVCVTGVK